MPKSSAVVSPNLGLYLDRPKLALSSRMLQDGNAFRVKNGLLSNLNLGWDSFSAVTLNGAVMLIANFFLRDGSEHLVFATRYDVYKYNVGPDTVTYLTQRYDTGTASAAGTAVTGVGTAWLTNAKIGDEIHFGDAAYATPTGTWFTIQAVNNDLSITLTASAGTVANGPYTIRRKFTGDEDDQWETATFVNASPSNEDELWLTNGVNDIFRWNGTDTQLSRMGSLGFTAKHIAVYSNMMIFGNLNVGGTNKPTEIINSDVGLPQNAGSAGTGLSEEFKVHGNTDEITGLRVLGDNLAIYSSNTVVVAQFVGDPLVFAFRVSMTGVGAIAGRAIADFGNFHEFMGNDVQYTFDGVTVRKVNEHVWREIIRQQDPVRIKRAYAHFDEENGDLLWVVPSTSDPGSGSSTAAPSRAFTEHYLEEPGQGIPSPYSKRPFPFTATGYFARQTGLTWDQITSQWQDFNFRWNDQFFFAAFPLNLAGDASGKLWHINTAQNANGAAIPSFVRFGRRATVDGRQRGLLKRIYPFASPFANTMYVSALMSDHAMGNATIIQTDTFDLTLPESQYFTSPFRTGRFFEVEFGSAGPSQPWEISGYDTDAASGGKR